MPTSRSAALTQVAEQVWSEAQKLVDDAHWPSVFMLFTPIGDASAPVHAMREFVLECG
jgi:hypothetical protein